MSLPLIGTLATFVLITVLANRKVPLHYCVTLGALLVGFCCGYNPLEIVGIIAASLVDPATIDLLAVIALICISRFHPYVISRICIASRHSRRIARNGPISV